MENVDQTIQSQYANSFALKAFIESVNDAIDPSFDFDNFYQFVWDVDTAVGFGLDIWGRIVGVGRTITVPSTQNYFGFSTIDNSWNPFNQAPFFNSSSGFVPATTFTLPDSAYRTLILVKAAANIANCAAPTLNALLQALFAGRGVCYVRDVGQMTMEYRFFFPLSPVEQAIVLNSGVFPKGAGVQIRLTIFPGPTGQYIGFAEAVDANNDAQPYGSGVLYPGGSVPPVVDPDFGFREAQPDSNTFDNGVFF